MKICNTELCTGCAACVVSCPFNCIRMQEDVIGHIYPIINEEQCVGCNQCIQACEKRLMYRENKAKQIFAAWSDNQIERRNSTSGGIATVLARYVIEKRGVVFGCAFDNGSFQHIRIENECDLSRIQGVKYVESNISNIYHQIKNELLTERKVMFVGTPCQCAGIKAYLKKGYGNLLLVDLICTGVPPQKLLWENLKLKPLDVDAICFRKGHETKLTVFRFGNVIYQNPVWKDSFLMGFSNHLFLRESCYQCEFAIERRVSDITLGDFWGLGKNISFDFDLQDGVSAVVINTIKGEEYFEAIKEYIFFEKRGYEEFKNGNPRYTSPSNKHRSTTKFKKYYAKKGFRKAISISLRIERIKYALFSIYKDFVVKNEKND